MKYAVIVDSSCDLVIENKTENNIYMDRVPLRLRVGEREYVDDFNLDIKSFMEDMMEQVGVQHQVLRNGIMLLGRQMKCLRLLFQVSCQAVIVVRQLENTWH